MDVQKNIYVCLLYVTKLPCKKKLRRKCDRVSHFLVGDRQYLDDFIALFGEI